MVSRMPAPLRRSPLALRLFAAVALMPLLLGAAHAVEITTDELDVPQALELSSRAHDAAAQAQEEAARLVQDDLANQPFPFALLPPLPDAPNLAAALPNVPPEFADLMLAHEQADAQLTTASLGTAHIALPRPAALAPVVTLAPVPQPPEPEAVIASGELFDPRMILRPSVPAAPPADLALVRQALSEYKRGNLSLGDAFAERVGDDAARLALEWVAIRTGKQLVGFSRLAAFAASNPDFPMAEWVQRRAEEALFVEKKPAATLEAFFANRAPETGPGKIALARHKLAMGEAAAAHELVRAAFRDDKTNTGIRAVVFKEFPGVITLKDQRYLAQRLIYDGETSEGQRVAQAAGPALAQLAQLLSASINETGGAAALLTKIDPVYARDAAVSFARVQHLRRSNQIAEAGRVMLAAPTDLESVVDGDEWWIERRMLVRKLLDSGDARTAYRVAAGHSAESSAHLVDAEVHAGWIALRFLNEPASAAGHFDRARAAALTPPSIARADYWRGRAADAAQDPVAEFAYLAASHHRHTFYGQLAMARIGSLHLSGEVGLPEHEALEAASRTPALRAIRVLLDSEARDLAQPLITDAARTASHLEQTFALGDLVARYGLPRLTLLAGKSALQRGLKAEEHAFPTFGIPPYDPAQGSAEPAIVYSIARQESEFDAGAQSHAGARGLMQLMPATARSTASRYKMPFDVNKLTADPAFNARIGAAHLGDLFGEYSGSYVLSFAAYNAGGGRVKEWTTAYGDPRDPNVDPIDWIERIPITETRHYVQKILENLQIYRSRLTGNRALGITEDLRRGLRKPKDPARQLAVSVPLIAAPDLR